MTYKLGLVFRKLDGGSIDRDGEDSVGDGEKLSRKRHGVGWWAWGAWGSRES